MARIGDYKHFEKEVPFTVHDSVKGASRAYNESIEARSLAKRKEARERTIDAWNQVQANRAMLEQDLVKVKLGLETSDLYKHYTKPKTMYTEKPSILSRIYNWFLSIKYN